MVRLDRFRADEVGEWLETDREEGRPTHQKRQSRSAPGTIVRRHPADEAGGSNSINPFSA